MPLGLRERLLATRPGFGAYMRLKWGGPARPRPGFAPLNTTLKTAAEISRAVQEAERLRLPPCSDTAKTWDTLGAVEAVLARCPADGAVLDAGAESYSQVLPWLYLYGFRNLRGNNLVFKTATRRGPIRYEPGDLTRTDYADRQFDAVTCLSVIEHGVDVAQYFAEMARIIKPGGLLVTSADYFDAPTDTRGQHAYGVPIKVFSRADMESALATAAAAGFVPTGPLDLACGERVVHWQKYELCYTFIIFALLRC